MTTSVVCLLAAAILPQRIIPNKIVYAVGERGWATAVFTNTSAKTASADYVVTDAWGVAGESREIARGKVELAPNAVRKLKVDWPGSRVRYGHEIRVTVRDGKEELSRAEYFAVNDDWWRVNQGCDFDAPKGRPTPLTERFLRYYGYPVCDQVSTGGRLVQEGYRRLGRDMGPFGGYMTLMTRWQMQKTSVGGNTPAAEMPDGVRWFTANGSMPRDSGEIRADSDFAHGWGMRHTRFTIDFMEGPFGFELARKHPEFMLRNERGQYRGRYQATDTDPKKIATPDCPVHYPWTYVEPNFFRADVIDWALKDLDGGIAGFREDGAYFDGRYAKDSGFDAFGNDLSKIPDHDAIIVENMRKTREVLLDGHPDRFVWCNGPNPRRPEQALLDNPRCGLLNELQWGFLLHPTMQSNNYRGFLESTLVSRDMVYLPSRYVKAPSKIHMVGYLCPGWGRRDPFAHREVWTMTQHAMSVVAASLAHPFAAGPQVRNFKQMMMRYAEFFWHEDIEVMKDGYKRFVCDSLREVWYDDMIYRRETEDYTDYYVHLVNVPESEMCREDVDVDPPEVDDAEISTKLFGTKGVRAWAIQPYAYDAARLEPTCVALTPKSVKGETVVPVPSFAYYTLVVIRVPK